MGGLLLFFLIFIIWFPLLLFSLSTTIFVPNPPADVTVNIKFWGYQVSVVFVTVQYLFGIDALVSDIYKF